MLAMVCWMILHSGTPFCSVPVSFADAIWLRNSLNADTSGSDIGPPYVVRQGTDLYRVAVAARIGDIGPRWVR